MGGEARPRITYGESSRAKRQLWSNFSFVASSGYREKVILSLSAKPKLPKQVATETGLRISHVSRALRELRGRGLVELLTPEVKSRGRLYAVTPSGAQLVAFSLDSSRQFGPRDRVVTDTWFLPKIRGSFARRCLDYVRRTKGLDATKKALAPWSVNLGDVNEDLWLPLEAYEEFFELLEGAFGDGSYNFVRELSFHAMPAVSPVREQMMKVFSLEKLAERAPIVYNKLWNYGRLEVKTGHRRATFLHYDWNPTPAMCAIPQGTYEGILQRRGVRGTVEKVRCVREGDDCCEYEVRW